MPLVPAYGALLPYPNQTTFFNRDFYLYTFLKSNISIENFDKFFFILEKKMCDSAVNLSSDEIIKISMRIMATGWQLWALFMPSTLRIIRYVFCQHCKLPVPLRMSALIYKFSADALKHTVEKQKLLLNFCKRNFKFSRPAGVAGNFIYIVIISVQKYSKQRDFKRFFFSKRCVSPPAARKTHTPRFGLLRIYISFAWMKLRTEQKSINFVPIPAPTEVKARQTLNY